LFAAEIIATFVLTYVYLQTLAHPRSFSPSLGPLAVGLAYTALLAASGPYSTGSLNPARTLGPAAVSGESADLWIWIVGPIVGAVLFSLRATLIAE
jgi:glycerol uptake facilitator-like aquaporin